MLYEDLEELLNEYNWDDGFETPKEILSNPYRKVTHGGIEHGNNTGSWQIRLYLGQNLS